MTDMEDMGSHKALVCRREHRADCGVGIVWLVCLADGYVIDCGSDYWAEARANTLAQLINVDPSRLTRANMNGWKSAA